MNPESPRFNAVKLSLFNTHKVAVALPGFLAFFRPK